MKINRLKLITLTIGIIILIGISLFAYRVSYNFVYNKSIEQEIIAKEKKEKAEINHKKWMVKVTGAKGNRLDELIQLHKDYKLDAETLKIFSELSTKFNVNPNKVLEALGMIDLSIPQTTKQRINHTLKKQRDKLYWLETKNSNPDDPWIKEKKEVINMCRIELTLINKAQKDKEIKTKLDTVRTQYLHCIYPRIYPWKGGGETKGGH